MTLVWIFASTSFVTLISLIGIFTLGIKNNFLEKVLFSLVGFSAGSLIGTAFLHILPEVLEKANSQFVFYYLILGIVLFFMLEKYFYWRHCHSGICDVHAFTYLNLVGDGLHNFIDGMVIAASFIISIPLGMATTLAVIFHEIPQELGDFGVLVYGGFSKRKALFYNFISGFMAMIGAVAGYIASGITANFSNFILSLTAGGFIYIAASDLIPQIHRENDLRRSTSAFIAFLLGIIFMALTRIFFEHYSARYLSCRFVFLDFIY